MSEYHSINCVFRTQYEAALISALQKIGYKPKIHETPVKLLGYRGDARDQKANIVIPQSQVGSASNDIGFLRQDDGTYLMHVSAYDKTKWDNKFPEIVKHYASGVVSQIVQNGPYEWESQSVDANGVTTIKLRVHE